MFTTNNKISPIQLKRIMVLSSTGISVMMSTGIATDYAVHDGLFCILLAYLFTMLYMYFTLYVCDKADWNYFTYMNKYAGHRLTNVLSLLFILKYTFLLVPAICYFVKLSRTALVPQRPIWFVMLPVVFLCLYMAIQGIEAIGRLAQCLYTITLAALLLPLLLLIPSMDKFYIAPLFHFSPNSMLCGSVWIFLLFFPVELIIFGSEYIDASDFKKRRSIKRSCFHGITIAYLLNLLYYLVNVGVLSINGIYADTTSAAMQLLNRFRISDILLLFFLLSLFFSLSILMFAVTGLLTKMLNHRKTIRLTVFIGIYLCSLSIFFLAPEFSSARFACENRPDIENRIFTNGIILSYDKEEESYTMSLIFPHNTEGKSVTEQVSADSLSQLIYEYGLHSDKQLDFSHTEVIFISNSIYENPNTFHDAIAYLNTLDNLNHRTILCGITDSPENFIHLNESLDTALGQYIRNLMKNNLKYSISTLDELRKVTIGAENACLISNFNIENGVPGYNGCTVITADGSVESYTGNSAAITNLATGKDGFVINLGPGHCYRITDNDCYINNTTVSPEKIMSKIIYSGSLTCLKNNDLTEKEINGILETLIFERLTYLKDDMSCDLLNIYKHLAIDDHRLYTMYAGSLPDFYDITYIEVECRYILE